MALDSVLRKGVAVAHKLTKSLQTPVFHRSWIRQDGFGKAEFTPWAERLAVVEQRLHKKVLPDGRLLTIQATLTFLDPVPALSVVGAQGRQDPIDPRDEIKLPDGSSGPIVYIAGPYDAAESRPFVTQVWLGIKGGQV